MNEPTKTHVAGISSAAAFTNRVLIIAAVVALGLIAWRMSHVFALVFAGVIVAMVLRAFSDPLAERARIPQRWALAAVVVAILALLGAAAWFFGDRIAAQFGLIAERLPQAWERLRGWLEQHQVGRLLLDGVAASFNDTGASPSRLAGFFTSTFGALADTAIVLVVGLYFAAEPGLYRRGLVALAPPRARPRLEATLDEIKRSLKRWLLGQSLAMLSIGVMTGLGLWALGVPMALALAVLAGVFEFVPYLGPFVAAIPALLIAFAQEPILALYVLVLYIAIQEVEEWALVPLIQRWAVKLPPALAILAVVIFGLLFGIIGILVATPLMLVLMIAVRRLYVEETLETSS